MHSSWIEAGLIGLPPRTRAAVASGGVGLDAVGVWLARWACAGIPAMPPVRSIAWPADVTEACALAGDELRRWWIAVGRDQVAALAVIANAPARLPPDTHSRARRLLPSLGERRGIVARCRDVALDEDGLLRIGARTIASHVEPLARRVLMHRLPRGIGLVAGEDLRAFAATPSPWPPAG